MGADERTHARQTEGGRAGGASTYHGVEMWFQSWPWQAQRGKVSATGDEHHLVQVLLWCESITGAVTSTKTSPVVGRDSPGSSR